MVIDAEFYDAIIQPLEDAMMACVWRITQNRENAQDALQEALATIWRKRHRIAAHPKPEALVLRICRDKAIDILRAAIRRSRWEQATAVSDEAWADPTAPAPEAGLHGQEILQHVRRIIAMLPRKQARAVLMHLVEEQSYADIAAALGCSEATVRSHVRRGRDRLQAELQPLYAGSLP